jgi:hypothetical protein
MLSADAVNIKNFVGGTQKPQRSFLMKTKRFFLFGLPAVLLALGLVLAGCDDGSGSGSGGGGSGNFDSALVATWHATQDDADSGANVVFEFSADGALTGDAVTSTINVTTSGGRISATITAGGQTVDGGSVAYEVDGNTLTLSDPSGGTFSSFITVQQAGDGCFYKSSGGGNGNGNGNGTGGGGNLPAIDETTTGQANISGSNITVTGTGMPQTLAQQTFNGGSFTISGGQFSFNLTTPGSTSALSSMDLPEGAPTFTLNPQDAQFAMVRSFEWNGGSISRVAYDTDEEKTYMDVSQIVYVYVNKNVAISSPAKNDPQDKWTAMNYSLQTGWNLVQMDIHTTQSESETTMRIATKNVPWVFEPNY